MNYGYFSYAVIGVICHLHPINILVPDNL